MKKLFLLLTISLFVGCENDEGKSEDEKTAEDIWQEIQGYSFYLTIRFPLELQQDSFRMCT